MTTETLHEPPLPELPPEIAEAVARTVTYANDDESITVIARGDMTLSAVDIQVFPQSEPTEIGAQLTSVCSVALDDVQQWTTATLLSSGLIDAETQQLMMGAGPMPESRELPDPAVVTDGDRARDRTCGEQGPASGAWRRGGRPRRPGGAADRRARRRTG